MFDQGQQQQQPIYNGVYYGGPVAPQVPKVMNVLTAEEIKELQAQRSQFSLGLTEREAKQAACNHRSLDGLSDSLIYDQNTGKATCQICGYTFRPIEANVSPETIQDAADRIVDILQTIKIMYTDIPANAAREYFQIIPLVAKTPQLFEFAAKSFNKHEFDRMQYGNRNMGGMAMLQNLNALFGAAQPGMPMGYPAGQPVAPGANAFGYPGASQQPVGYQPQAGVAGYTYTPNVAAPVAAPASAPVVQAPAAPVDAPVETTVQEKVTV